MSVRAERKKHFALIVAAVILFMLAASVGYSVGYGVNGEKREALAEQNRTLAAQGLEAEEALSKFAAMEKNAADLTAENEALKAEAAALKEENEQLKAKVKESEAAVNYAASLDEGQVNEAETTNAGSSNFLDIFTRVIILIIIAVLVVMGLSMLTTGRRRRGRDERYDPDEEDYDEEDDLDDGDVYDESGTSYDTIEEEAVADEPTRRIDLDGIAPGLNDAKEEKPQRASVFQEDKAESEKETKQPADDEAPSPADKADEVKVPDTLKELVGEEASPVVPDSLEELMLRSIKQREKADKAVDEVPDENK